MCLWILCSQIQTKIMEINSSLYKNNCHVDIQRLKKYKNYVQFFAAFVDKSLYSNTLKRALEIIDVFYKEVESCKDHIMYVVITMI